MIAFEKPNEKKGIVRKKHNGTYKEHVKPRTTKPIKYKQDHLDH